MGQVQGDIGPPSKADQVDRHNNGGGAEWGEARPCSFPRLASWPLPTLAMHDQGQGRAGQVGRNLFQR
jgi:hypothetical protein